MNQQIGGNTSNYQQLDGRAKVKGSGCLGAGLIIGIIVVLFIVIGIMAWSSYNGMVEKEEAVNSKWGDVENVYQRRADLILNLVETVKGYASHEQTTLTEVQKARSEATKVTIDPTKLTEENIKQFEAAQNSLSTTLSRLMMVTENYPNLKADAHFTQLMTDLKETEAMIIAERAKFNPLAQAYNTYIRRFPKNLFAGLFGFEPKGYFKAEEGADKAPKVKF